MTESQSVAGPSTWSSNGHDPSLFIDTNGNDDHPERPAANANGKGKGKARFADDPSSKRSRKGNDNVKGRIGDMLKDIGYDGDLGGEEWWDDENEIPPSPIALLPHNIVIDCPPLTTTRSIPQLVAQTLPTHSTHQKRTSSRAYTLPLPSHLASSPYTYGSSTLIVGAHSTGRYLLAFFPRLATSITRRCMTAALAAQRISTDGQRDSTNDSITELLQSDQEEDLGGCVVLYAKPKATLMTLGVPIYSHAFEIHSWYDVESEPISCLWLYPPRRWIAIEDIKVQDHEDEDDGINNEEESMKKPPRLDRLPPHGPRPPIATTDVSAPTFFLLFTDHRLSLYFPTMNTLAARSVAVEADRSLRVLTSSILVPNVVNCDQLSGSLIEPKPEGRGSIGGDQIRTTSSTCSRRRRIRRKQMTMSLRANDESIWVAFQSTVIDRLVSSSSESGTTTTYDPMALMGMAGMGPGFDQSSFNGIPMIQGNQTSHGMFSGVVPSEVTDQVQSVVVERPREGEHELWVNLIEIRVDLLSPTATLQITPQPSIPLPKPTFDPSTPQVKQPRYALDGIAFTELKWAEERQQVEDGGMDTRDLGLLLILQKLEGEKRSTCFRLHTLRETRITLSDALGSLGPGAGGGRKAMQEAEQRFEWLSQGVQEATLQELASTVSTQDATLLHRVLLHAPSGSLSWLNTQELKLEQDPGIFIQEDVRNTSLAVGFADRLIIASQGRRSLRVLDLSKGHKDPHMWLRHLAGSCAAALMEDAEDIPSAMSLLTRVPGPDIDTVIDMIWKALDMQDSGHVHIEHSDWLLPLLKLQFGLFKQVNDPRQEVAKDFLHLVAMEEAFDLCATSIKIQVANGTNGVKVPQFIPRYYDIDSLWFLIAHVEWYLTFLRLALRDLVIVRSEMMGDTVIHSVPHSITTLLHPFGRSLLQSINSHLISFEKFVISLRRPILLPSQAKVPNMFNIQAMTVDGRDATATALAKDILQDRLQSSGLSIPGLMKALKEVEESTTQKHNGADVDVDMDQESENQTTDWRHTSLLHCRLVPTPSLQTIITQLSSSTVTQNSQIYLFFSPTIMELQPIPMIDRDILTKESIQQTIALGPLRKCSSCGGLSSARGPVMIGGDVRDTGSSRWMLRWSESCICGGVWTPA